MARYLRIEWIAVTMILLMLALSYLIEVKQHQKKQRTFTKEFEVYHSVTVEVNASNVESRIFSDYGVRDKGELRLTNFVYAGKSLKELRADQGRYIDDKIYLDQNITVLQKEGYIYKGDHAVYDKRREFLHVTSPFVAYINRNVVRGTNLQYDLKGKVATAENVDAVIYTSSQAE